MLKINLTKILTNKKMTLTELSKKTGIAMKTLSALKNKQVESVQFRTIDEIIKVLDIEISDLLSIENTAILLEVEFQEAQDVIVSTFIFHEISDNNNDSILFELELLFKIKKTHHCLMTEYYTDNNRNMINYIQENIQYDLKDFLQVLSYALVQEISFKKDLISKNNVIVDFTKLVSS